MLQSQPTLAARYVTVSPDTWSLIRGAYLSGLSARTVAGRFGAAEGALRKRAARECSNLSSSSGKPRLRGADRGTQRRAGARNCRERRPTYILPEQIAFGAAGSPGLAALAGG